MQNVKTCTPDAEEWIVYCAVDVNNGHASCGLGQWSDDLEAQLLDAELDAYWTYASAPAIARIKGAIKRAQDELASNEIQIDDLSKQISELETYLNELIYDDTRTPSSES